MTCDEPKRHQATLRYYDAWEVLAGWREVERRPTPTIPTQRDEHDVQRAKPSGTERPGERKRHRVDTALIMWLHVERFLQTRHLREIDEAKFAAWYERRPLMIVPAEPFSDPPLHDCPEYGWVPLREAVAMLNAKTPGADLKYGAAHKAGASGLFEMIRPMGKPHTTLAGLTRWYDSSKISRKQV